MWDFEAVFEDREGQRQEARGDARFPASYTSIAVKTDLVMEVAKKAGRSDLRCISFKAEKRD